MFRWWSPPSSSGNSPCKLTHRCWDCVPCYALTAKYTSRQTNSISNGSFLCSCLPWIAIFDVHVNMLGGSCLALHNLLYQMAALVLSSLSLVPQLKMTSLVVLFCCRSRDTAVGMVPMLNALRPLNRGWIPGRGKRPFSSSGLLRVDQILATRPRVQSVAVVTFHEVKRRTH
jgi:hypothetical protein